MLDAAGSEGKCQGLSNLRLRSRGKGSIAECDTNIREWLGVRFYGS